MSKFKLLICASVFLLLPLGCKNLKKNGNELGNTTNPANNCQGQAVESAIQDLAKALKGLREVSAGSLLQNPEKIKAATDLLKKSKPQLWDEMIGSSAVPECDAEAQTLFNQCKSTSNSDSACRKLYFELSKICKSKTALKTDEFSQFCCVGRKNGDVNLFSFESYSDTTKNQLDTSNCSIALNKSSKLKFLAPDVCLAMVNPGTRSGFNPVDQTLTRQQEIASETVGERETSEASNSKILDDSIALLNSCENPKSNAPNSDLENMSSQQICKTVHKDIATWVPNQNGANQNDGVCICNTNKEIKDSNSYTLRDPNLFALRCSNRIKEFESVKTDKDCTEKYGRSRKTGADARIEASYVIYDSSKKVCVCASNPNKPLGQTDACCDNGEYLAVDGRCYIDKKCKTDEYLAVDGICYKKKSGQTINTSCPFGQYLMNDGSCVNDADWEQTR